MRGGRRGIRLRRHRRGRGQGRRHFRASGDADQGHAQSGQPRRRVAVVAPADRRRRTRAHGIHHQQHDQNPSDGARAVRSARGPGRASRDRAAHPRAPGQDQLLRRIPDRRDRSDRRRALPEPGDRPDERLQDQRVRGAHRRAAVRARGREPDARLARRQPLLGRGISRGVCAGVRGNPQGARSHRASPTCSS